VKRSIGDVQQLRVAGLDRERHVPRCVSGGVDGSDARHDLALFVEQIDAIGER
jgi:hypothetical protein